VKIESLSGEYEHITSLNTVLLAAAVGKATVGGVADGTADRATADGATGRQISEHKMLSVRGRGKYRIVLFDKIDSPERAASYRGAEILIERSDAHPLAEGEYYLADLVNCGVFFNDTKQGHVHAIWNNRICDMLEILCLDGRTAHVPFQDMFIGWVDIQSECIELKVNWILE
ncbi:MAG: ribosome maturation factor RimM, partial [Salinispira sp.]